MNDAPQLRRLRKSDGPEQFDQIASLHLELIHGGILSLLGKKFLANLYREIAFSRHGCVIVALQTGRVVGFIAGASDIWRCALTFSLTGYLKLGFLFLGHLGNPGVVAKASDSLAYPFRRAQTANEGGLPQNLHRAEILAIAVAQNAQGQGIGGMLVSALEEVFKLHVDHYFVTTNIDETPSNIFYKKIGFAEAGRKKHHALVLQTYVKRLR